MNGNSIVSLNLINFGIVYLLLLVVLAIMKQCRINQAKLLIIGSVRMTAQLIVAGLILQYIFDNPHGIYVVLYLFTMTAFAIYTTLSRNREINREFKKIVACSLAIAGLSMVIFFITIIVGVSIFNPQYTIPIAGMLIGNAMTGISLGVKTFNNSVLSSKNQVITLLNLGVTPKKILSPFVNSAIETALLPTINTMIGMGIVSLPGMMTGQILAGTLPMTAILYQIAIIISITTVTTISVFCSLYFGSRTMYNKQAQIIF